MINGSEIPDQPLVSLHDWSMTDSPFDGDLQPHVCAPLHLNGRYSHFIPLFPLIGSWTLNPLNDVVDVVDYRSLVGLAYSCSRRLKCRCRISYRKTRRSYFESRRKYAIDYTWEESSI